MNNSSKRDVLKANRTAHQNTRSGEVDEETEEERNAREERELLAPVLDDDGPGHRTPPPHPQLARSSSQARSKPNHRTAHQNSSNGEAHLETDRERYEREEREMMAAVADDNDEPRRLTPPPRRQLSRTTSKAQAKPSNAHFDLSFEATKTIDSAVAYVESLIDESIREHGNKIMPMAVVGGKVNKSVVRAVMVMSIRARLAPMLDHGA